MTEEFNTILKAYKEDRLVILPVPLGSTVYRVVPKCRPSINECPFDGGQGMPRCNNGECEPYIQELRLSMPMIGMLGVYVFTTKEEAEAAMKSMTEVSPK